MIAFEIDNIPHDWRMNVLYGKKYENAILKTVIHGHSNTWFSKGRVFLREGEYIIDYSHFTTKCDRRITELTVIHNKKCSANRTHALQRFNQKMCSAKKSYWLQRAHHKKCTAKNSNIFMNNSEFQPLTNHSTRLKFHHKWGQTFREQNQKMYKLIPPLLISFSKRAVFLSEMYTFKKRTCRIFN